MMPIKNAFILAKTAAAKTLSSRSYSFDSRVFGTHDTIFGMILKITDLGSDPTKNYQDIIDELVAKHMPRGCYDTFEITPCVFKGASIDASGTVTATVAGAPHITALKVEFDGTKLTSVPNTSASMVPRRSSKSVTDDSSKSCAISKSGIMLPGEDYIEPAAFQTDETVFKRLFMPKDYGVGPYGAHKYIVFLNQEYSSAKIEEIQTRLMTLKSEIKSPASKSDTPFAYYDRQRSSCGHYALYVYTGILLKEYGLEPQQAVMAIIHKILTHPDPSIREEALTDFSFLAKKSKLHDLAETYMFRLGKIVEYSTEKDIEPAAAPLK